MKWQPCDVCDKIADHKTVRQTNARPDFIVRTSTSIEDFCTECQRLLQKKRLNIFLQDKIVHSRYIAVVSLIAKWIIIHVSMWGSFIIRMTVRVSKCGSFNQNANITCELVEVGFVRIGPWGLLHWIASLPNKALVVRHVWVIISYTDVWILMTQMTKLMRSAFDTLLLRQINCFCITNTGDSLFFSPNAKINDWRRLCLYLRTCSYM